MNRWIVGSILGVAGWAIARSLQAAPVPDTWKPVSPTQLFGMQYVPKFDEHLGRGSWDGTRERGIAQHLELGVQMSREGLLWRHYEPNQGNRPHLADFDDMVQQLTRHGITVVAMVSETPTWAATHPDHGPTARYSPPRGLYEPIYANGTDSPGANGACNPKNTWACALDHMARRYQGRIRHWQIWNEPDYPDGELIASTDPRRSWQGSVQDYVRLLQVASVVLKRIDPPSRVLLGGLGHPHYLSAILANGGGAWFDTLDFHAYGKPGSDRALQAFEDKRDAMLAVLKQTTHQDKSVTCSETGYTADDAITQADFITKVYTSALASDIQSVMYYATCNPSWQRMGLVDWRTLTQRTRGFWAYQQARQRLGTVKSLRPIQTAGVSGIHGRRQGKDEVLVVWGKPGTTFRWPASEQPWFVFDNLGHLLGRVGAHVPLQWPVDEHPMFIERSSDVANSTERPNPPLPRRHLPFASASASSEDVGGAAGQAIDLDWDTAWAPTHGARQSSLTLSLSRTVPVEGLWLKTAPTPRGCWFDFQVRDTSGTYRTVATRLSGTAWNRRYYRFPAAFRAEALRLVWHNPQSVAATCQVFECE